MSIINQGAFFSPYYLFDLLGRQHALTGRCSSARFFMTVMQRVFQQRRAAFQTQVQEALGQG